MGWVGDYGNENSPQTSYAHKNALQELLYPALINLTFPVKLVLMGVRSEKDKTDIESFFKVTPHVELEIPQDIDWMCEEEICNMISHFDIGVAPLINHEFNQAKSAFKVKQYLSCGIPVIASDVGENKKFIRHGETGFLCKTSLEFEKHLNTYHLMGNKDYCKMSKNALESVDCFSMEKYCQVFVA